MLKYLIMVGGSAMIMQAIADRVQRVKIDRENTQRRRKTRIMALGITIGSTIGAAAGVLLTPRTGKETREYLTRLGWGAWGKVKEDASHTGHRLISAVEERTSRVAAEAAKCVDTAKGALKEPAKELRE